MFYEVVRMEQNKRLEIKEAAFIAAAALSVNQTGIAPRLVSDLGGFH